jgi:hypothetical protein
VVGSNLFLLFGAETGVMVGCPPLECARTIALSTADFLSVSVTHTASHASVAQIIRMNS